MTKRKESDSRVSRRGFVAGSAALAGGTALAGSFAGRIAPAAAAAHAKAKLDAVLAEAVATDKVPFVVAMLGNADGVLWSGSAGEHQPGKAIAPDAVMRAFSMTKAVGSTAAMILMDRGKLSADTPVADVIPKFAEMQVLDGWDGDKPRMRAPKTTCTVRHLATHTNGTVYEVWNADMPKYMKATGLESVVSGKQSALMYPMIFDPGAKWDYGIGIDWLGQMVEAIDGRRIDKFCADEIFGPLGMADTVFELEDGRAERVPTMYGRGEDGKFAETDFRPPAKPEFYGMGHALYTTASDYMRFLRMFLNKGQLDGNRVLSEAGVATMLANHIGDLRMEKMVTVAPPISADVDLFPGIDKTHSLGFLRVEQDVPGMRSAGSQGWAGVCNTHYWFDPAKDVAGVLMTQTLPFVEPPFMQLYENFERAVYAL